MSEEKDILRHRKPKHLGKIGIGVAVIAAALVVFGIASRASSNKDLQQTADDVSLPSVKVIQLDAFSGDQSLALPAILQAYNSAPIHARISGYLKKWYVDIGAAVKTGQVLGEIDVPDLDQQLAQAKADLNVAMANERLAKSTATRWHGLLAEDAVSKQDDDQKQGDMAARTAQVSASRAAVERLQAMEDFKKIIAPFDGTVTTRSTDIGALINVGGANDAPLFTVSDERKLRVYVEVPQGYSSRVKQGMNATFSVPQHPNRTFNATVVTTSSAINVPSGTLRVQLLVGNKDHALHPGDYAQLKFELDKSNAVSVPASALVFRDSGMAVAILENGDHVKFKQITVGRDFGTAVEVVSGLTPKASIIDNPPDVLRDGDKVRLEQDRPKQGGG